MKLMQKLTLKFLIAAAIPFGLGTVVMLLFTREIVHKAMEEISVNYAKNESLALESFFSDWKKTAETMSNFDAVRRRDWTEVLPSIRRMTGAHSEITDFVLTNRDGTYWYSGVPGNSHQDFLVTEDDTAPDAGKKNISTLEYHRVLVEGNRYHENMQFVSEPYIAFANGKKMLAICSTVFDEANKVSGVVGSTVELDVLDTQLYKNLEGLTDYYGQKAQFMLVSHESQLALHYVWDVGEGKYVDSLHKQLVLYGTDILPEAVTAAMQDLAGSGEKFFYFNGEGGKTFLARQPIAGSDYSVYLLVPTSQLFYADGIVSAIVGVMGAVMFITLAIAAFVILSHDVIKPVTKTSKALGDISAGDGDLTMRLDQSRRDEIGDLGGKFNVFVGNIHSIVSSIKGEAGKLEEVSVNLEGKVADIDGDMRNISQNVANLNAQADEQSASAVETASTVEQISRNISNLTESIDHQVHAVSESSSAIHQMVENINSIAENLEKASKRFDDLQEASTTGKTNISAVQTLVTSVSEQSEKLLDTNKLINSIANQTNLLAMNAAIEAAHAGEAGRGFSVVAEEIRKLAEDSSKQSKTIADELKSIVSHIADIVAATAKAGVSFDTVVSQVEASSRIVEEITSSLKEQTVGNNQVLKSLEDIHGATVEVRGSAQEMGHGTATILKEMTRLKDIAQQVQHNARGISDAVDTIGVAVKHIKTNSEQNTGSVETLNDLSGRFKL